MDIQSLYEKIEAQIIDNSFRLSEAATEMQAFGTLCRVFGLDEICLKHFACSLQNEELRLQGDCVISSCYDELNMDTILTDDGQISAAFTMPELCLDMSGLFRARDLKMTVRLCEGCQDFCEEMEGGLSFGGIDFSVTSNRADISSRRQLDIKCEEKVKVTDLVNAALSLFELDLSLFGIEQADLFNITSFDFVYTADSAWLTASSDAESDEKYSDDYFEWKIKTDIGFRFRDIFGLKQLGFCLEKYGNDYDLALDGDMEIFGAKCPFFICYRTERFDIALSRCEQVQLNSIEDMGVLNGERNILENFPPDFKPSGKVLLHTLNLEIAPDFDGILSFNILVLLDYRWQLAENPSIQLSDILVSFSDAFDGKTFGISGNIRFCDVDTTAYAVVMAEQDKSVQWRFGWRMYDNESVNLTKFIGQLADSLGVSPTQIKLPEIEVGNIYAEYFAGAFSVGMDIFVTDSKLFSSEMSIRIDSFLKDGTRDYTAEFQWESRNHELTVENILIECGASEAVSDLPDFIKGIGPESLKLNYDFLENRISSKIRVSGIGALELEIVFRSEKAYLISFAPDVSQLAFGSLPIVGSLVNKLLPSSENFSISNPVLNVRSGDVGSGQVPEGVGLELTVMGEKKVCMLYEKNPDKKTSDEKNADACADYSGQEPKIVWLNIQKTIAIFSLYRLGVGVDGAHIVFAADASLDVSPLTFALTGAGIGVNMSDPADIQFYISGFGVSFRNEMLTISGEFAKSSDAYSGELLIKVKQISAAAIAEYSEDGALMAFAAVTGNFGGSPAFFVTGVSFGFGYNKKLNLPDITKVKDYPLIEAAKGKLSREGLSEKLKQYFVTESGQKFLAAGIRFTSFEIVDSSAILTVNFGNSFEVGLIGLSEMKMPPKCDKSPIAYAGLALRAVFNPEDGIFCAEAQLTSESYILSKDCKLTGGFALYSWFAGEHSGDMVITLGGYRNGYQKPEHYPDVPRVGFNWKIGDHLNLSGEIYFALTPKEIMAGGRLSAVYSLGKLKAYFIAALDLYMAWKPFAYEASLQVCVGASYRLDCWFVHHTFTVELGAGLHIWGPEFAGTAHINWFIISFTISFGSGSKPSDQGIEWNEFVDSFLPKEETHAAGVAADNEAQKADPVTIQYEDGVIGAQDGTLCRADALRIRVESVIPITAYSWNESDPQNTGCKVCVQPMKEKNLENCLNVKLLDEEGRCVDARTSLVKKNLPSALWGQKSGDALVKDVSCGIVFVLTTSAFALFPVKNSISLEKLYLLETTIINDAFDYRSGGPYSSYTTEDSLQVVSDTINAAQTQNKRREFLESQGIVGEEISLARYCANARNLLSEDVMIKERG